MNRDVKYKQHDKIRFLIGRRIYEGIIRKVHETGYEVETDDEKQYLIHYNKILEIIQNTNTS